MADYSEAIYSSKAYETILKDSRSSRLTHTYLLLSEDKDYLKAFARVLAKVMLKVQKGSAAEMKIDKDIHPDVILYGETEKYTTDMVSEISTNVYIMPYEGDNKVYVLLNMQDMGEEAQNKLLKTIEEPPSCAFFILASTQEKKLLQTVLSRSKKIELDLVERDVMMKMLANEGVNEKEINICTACSSGVFSRALRLATDKEFLSMYQNIFNCLYKMNSSRDVLDFVSIFSAKSIDKAELADLFMLIVRDLIMVKTNNQNLIQNKHKVSELGLIANGFSLRALYKIIEYCLQLKEDLVYNTSIGSSIDQFLLKVVEVKVRCKE